VEMADGGVMMQLIKKQQLTYPPTAVNHYYIKKQYPAV